MFFNSDIHTHTNFSDGKNIPEEMVKSAIERGLFSYGVSEHSPCKPADYGMSDVKGYIKTVKELKEKYKEQIQFFCGVEEDGAEPLKNPNDFDYIIGSIHYICKNGIYYAIDSDQETIIKCRDEEFSGDGVKMAMEYFNSLAEYLLNSNADIAAHFDLITKCNNNEVFDENDKRYIDTALSVAEAIVQKGLIFEINTGAISRGYKKLPYPDFRILKFLNEKGAKITLSSDAHTTEHICYFFEESKEIAKEAGFKTLWQLTDKGFIETEM